MIFRIADDNYSGLEFTANDPRYSCTVMLNRGTDWDWVTWTMPGYFINPTWEFAE